MTKRALIAGNWKMNTTLDEAAELAASVAGLTKDAEGVDIVLAPPSISLDRVAGIIKDTNVSLSAQNLYFEESGAFTGELSAKMLASVGCEYVIIGHSERRELFGETDEGVNRKIMAALKEGLKPIVCVGETLEEREAGRALERVSSQVRVALSGLTNEEMADVAVAYEPIWAIGTGRTASPEDAEEVHACIRGILLELYGEELSAGVRIIYGGSVKPDNVDTLMSMKNINGALVGGASLKAEGFARIVNFEEAG